MGSPARRWPSESSPRASTSMPILYLDRDATSASRSIASPPSPGFSASARDRKCVRAASSIDGPGPQASGRWTPYAAASSSAIAIPVAGPHPHPTRLSRSSAGARAAAAPSAAHPRSPSLGLPLSNNVSSLRRRWFGATGGGAGRVQLQPQRRRPDASLQSVARSTSRHATRASSPSRKSSPVKETAPMASEPTRSLSQMRSSTEVVAGSSTLHSNVPESQRGSRLFFTTSVLPISLPWTLTIT
mmetsp:Transcript_32051/g.98959  ORF Transcript_32051/g.98959 Transcript_32051/m.98959 type:complete len:244 (-) Transcript_32051:2193-2924(-)